MGRTMSAATVRSLKMMLPVPVPCSIARHNLAERVRLSSGKWSRARHGFEPHPEPDPAPDAERAAVIAIAPHVDDIAFRAKINFKWRWRDFLGRTYLACLDLAVERRIQGQELSHALLKDWRLGQRLYWQAWREDRAGFTKLAVLTKLESALRAERGNQGVEFPHTHDPLVAVPSREHDPAEIAIQNDEAAAVRAALDAMPTDCRKLTELLVEGSSNKEVRNALFAGSERKAKRRVQEAADELAERLAPHGREREGKPLTPSLDHLHQPPSARKLPAGRRAAMTTNVEASHSRTVIYHIEDTEVRCDRLRVHAPSTNHHPITVTWFDGQHFYTQDVAPGHRLRIAAVHQLRKVEAHSRTTSQGISFELQTMEQEQPK
jgi:hypothetical protein